MSDSEINSIQENARPRDPNDYTGRSIEGYKVLEKLGAGTFGEVYVGERDGKKFALKLLPTNDPLLASTLQKELDAQKGLKHPNIREIYDFCPNAHFDDNNNDPLSLLVMEYVDGTHLKVAEVDNNALYVIALRVKEALEAAHNQGIINKDVKPTNILVAKDSQAKVCDFGLAKKVEEHSMGMDCSMPVTSDAPQRSLQSPGTYGYFPPGEKADSPAYDLFSFGVTLYQMVLQQIEFPDADVFDDVKTKAEERGLANPEGLAELIKNLTLKKQKRPKDFTEVEKTKGWKAIYEKAQEIAEYGKIGEEVYDDLQERVQESSLDSLLKQALLKSIRMYYHRADKIPELEKRFEELLAEQEKPPIAQEDSQANFPIYKKYIHLINDINPKKITDELADNIAYSAWKEGLAPKYVDFIVESIARRREKGLLRRIKEGLFETEDEYSGKSKAELREELRKQAKAHPKYLKHIKNTGRKHNIFVEDIFEEAVRELATANVKAENFPLSFTTSYKQLEAVAKYCHNQNVPIENILEEAAIKIETKFWAEVRTELLLKKYPKAFEKRPTYSQLVKDTEKICKIHYLNPSFLGKVMKGSIAYASTQSAVWIATGNSMAGVGAGAVSSLAYHTYAMYQQKKTEARWEQQNKDQESIDETVKKLMQGEEVEPLEEAVVELGLYDLAKSMTVGAGAGIVCMEGAWQFLINVFGDGILEKVSHPAFTLIDGAVIGLFGGLMYSAIIDGKKTGTLVDKTTKTGKESTIKNKTGLLGRIKNYLLTDVDNLTVNHIAPPLFLGGLASAIATYKSSGSLLYTSIAGLGTVAAGLLYMTGRQELSRKAKEKKAKEDELSDNVNQLSEAFKSQNQELQETPGNKIHIFSPIGVASLKRVVSDAYSTLRKKFSKKKKTDEAKEREETKQEAQRMFKEAAKESFKEVLTETVDKMQQEYTRNSKKDSKQTDQDLSEKPAEVQTEPVQDSYQQNEPEPPVEELKPVEPEPEPEPQDSDNSEHEEEENILYE